MKSYIVGKFLNFEESFDYFLHHGLANKLSEMLQKSFYFHNGLYIISDAIPPFSDELPDSLIKKKLKDEGYGDSIIRVVLENKHKLCLHFNIYATPRKSFREFTYESFEKYTEKVNISLNYSKITPEEVCLLSNEIISESMLNSFFEDVIRAINVIEHFNSTKLIMLTHNYYEYLFESYANEFADSFNSFVDGISLDATVLKKMVSKI